MQENSPFTVREIAMQENSPFTGDARGPARVRPYRPVDEAAASQLHRDCTTVHGIHDSRRVEQDAFAAYLRRPDSHFWLAESRHQLLGLVGVVANSAEVGEIGWLHVMPGSQAAHVAARLLEAALAHCRDQGYLKLVLGSLPFWDDKLAEHFRRFGFQQSRTKYADGTDALQFYRDLYRRLTDESARGAAHPWWS